MSTENQKSTTETPSSQVGVSSRLPWSLEEKRFLFDVVQNLYWGYGPYSKAEKLLNEEFGTARTRCACRAMHRRMIIRP